MTKQRNTLTKEKIKNAFCQLLIDKGMDALTVSDISRLADINRGTFYLHYVDKYDLLKKLEDNIIEDLEVILLDEDQLSNTTEPTLFPYQSVYNALTYVKNDFPFIHALASPNGDPMFVTRFKQVLILVFEKKIRSFPNIWQYENTLPSDYAQEILISGIMGIIQLWIKKGGEEPIEQIAQIITKTRHLSADDIAKNI
ncbi:TetR/AcrR family transcriptional regulator [Aerococcus christensenii]|uniref:Transcriptional regulator, TetR family n=1 Tax=Aerococcus christensenii TaxID=87541 RepID=A0A133Y126_9LACT|nr:TetR/AcrR family transcriptional regulator [Aerococcus christensenii]KXB36886.1 transcriptional regulator, TetR family [Aerococcus christensenii]MDK8234501.1 TetR/AcrR family transcriptional regulator [Aerococcus christensenii]